MRPPTKPFLVLAFGQHAMYGMRLHGEYATADEAVRSAARESTYGVTCIAVERIGDVHAASPRLTAPPRYPPRAAGAPGSMRDGHWPQGYPEPLEK